MKRAYSAGGWRVSVAGRGLEKLLRAAQERGAYPREVRRDSLRAMSLRLNSRELKVFRQVCVELNIEITRAQPLGATYALRRLRRRAALPLAAAVCVLAMGLMSTRIWQVQIDAPEVMRAPLEQALDALGVTPGAARDGLDLGALETALSAAVPEVKFCQARVRGVVLTLTAQQVTPAPDTASLYPPGGLYAACDAVVDGIHVLAGHAAVQRGDTVRAGDLLIAGEEQVSRESSVPVRAMGVVTGRVWYEAIAEAPLSYTVTERTGGVRVRRALRLLGLEHVIEPAEGYALCDTEVTVQPIGGLLLPLNVETVRYYELTQREARRSQAEAQQAAGELASQNAVKKCPDNATVIDKWTEYSIIEGNIIQARCVIETLQTIQCRDAALTD